MGKNFLFAVMVCFAMAGVAGVSSSRANAAVLANSIHVLKSQQTSIAEKTRYRCWWRNGRRHCRWVGPWRGHRHCWWRNGRRICRW